MEKKSRDCLLLVAYIILTIILPKVIGNLNHDITVSFNTYYSFFTYLILFMIIILLKTEKFISDYKKFKKNLWEEVNRIITYALIVILLFVITGILISNLHISNENENTINQYIYNNQILTGICIIFLGPVVEEIIFRQLFMDNMKKYILATLISSILFGLIHCMDGVILYRDLHQLINGLNYFVFGFSLCLVYKKTKNIYSIIIIHAASNILAMVSSSL